MNFLILLIYWISQSPQPNIVHSHTQPSLTMDSLEINLVEYRWKNRLMLIFSPNPTVSAYRQQLGMLENETPELEDRDMLVFHFFGNGNGQLNEEPIKSASVRAIYDKYNLSKDDFAVILVGKDGGEKMRKLSPTAMRDIYALIDGMPMRRREMRENDGQ